VLTLSRIADQAASLFCSHEFATRHEARRWYLECVHCGTTTPGIEVGPPQARTDDASSQVVALRVAPLTTRAA